MFVDYIQNGQAHGDVAEAMAGCHFDPGLLRPFIDESGTKCVTANTGRMTFNEKTGQPEPIYEKKPVAEMIANGVNLPIYNATSLRKDEWLMLDRVVLKAARSRLRAWADLMASNSFGGFNGMAKMVLEHEAMTDPGEAIVDMDGLTDGRTDAPKFQLEGLPLPITHSDFWYSSRRLAVSRNTGTPLDTTMGEAAGRRVAEMIEKVTIGVTDLSSFSYGSATDYGQTPAIYGYTTHPLRTTKTDLTTPTGANPASTLADVLAMRQTMYTNSFYGPFMIYHSSDWDTYLDNDYVAGTAAQGLAAPGSTLRQRLMAIEGIQGVRRLDFLTDTFTLLLVQMTSDVARAVNGMDITTVQWESQGGMRVNFKVMAIQVPQIRGQFIGQSQTTQKAGILHATTS